MLITPVVTSLRFNSDNNVCDRLYLPWRSHACMHDRAPPVANEARFNQVVSNQAKLMDGEQLLLAPSSSSSRGIYGAGSFWLLTSRGRKSSSQGRRHTYRFSDFNPVSTPGRRRT